MSNPYARLVLISDPCEESAICQNSPENAGTGGAQCYRCEWSPAPGEDDYWKAINKQVVHLRRQLALWQRKREKQSARDLEKVVKRKSRDPRKIEIGRRAARAEKITDRNIIVATRNSGRSHKDGDHLSAGVIVLDTKLQTRRIHPVVNLAELAKVRADARRNGYGIGALVLRNKSDYGVVCLDEEDYARLVRMAFPEITAA